MSTANTTTRPSAPRDAERRDFFRINQDVMFEYKVVEIDAANTASPGEHFDQSPALELLSQIRKIDLDNKKVLNILKDKNRLFTDYMQSLNTKIDLVTRFCLFSQQGEKNDQSTTRVNISEGGVAFNCDKAVYKGNFLALRLIFLPSYVHVLTFGEVVRCNHTENGNSIAARFHRISDKDRQDVSRHIYKAQVQQKQMLN